MRILFLSILFLGALYYLLPVDSQHVHYDQVKVKLSAPQNAVAKVPRPLTSPRQLISTAHSAAELSAEEVDEEVDEEAPMAKEPKRERLEGWQRDIRDYLIKAEPQDGEEIFSQYLAEKAAFRTEQREAVEERESIYRDEDGQLSDLLYQKNQEIIQDYDLYLEQIAHKHDERLRQILGAYYEEVKLHHDQTQNPMTHYAEPVEHNFE